MEEENRIETQNNTETIVEKKSVDKETVSGKIPNKWIILAIVVVISICAIIALVVILFTKSVTGGKIVITPSPTFTLEPEITISPTIMEDTEEEKTLEVKVLKTSALELENKICYVSELFPPDYTSAYVRCSDPLVQNVEDVMEVKSNGAIQINIIEGKIVVLSYDASKYVIYDPQLNEIVGEKTFYCGTYCYDSYMSDLDTIYSFVLTAEEGIGDEFGIYKNVNGNVEMAALLEAEVPGRGLGTGDISTLQASPEDDKAFFLTTWMILNNDYSYDPILFVIDNGVSIMENISYAGWRDNDSLWMQYNDSHDFGIYNLNTKTFEKKISGAQLGMMLAGRIIDDTLIYLDYTDDGKSFIGKIDLNDFSQGELYRTENYTIPLADSSGKLLLVEYTQAYGDGPFPEPELVKLLLIDPKTGLVSASVDSIRARIGELMSSVSIDFSNNRNPGYIPSFWAD